MPKEKESSQGAKYALIGTIVTAVIGLLGTALTLGIKYVENEQSRHDTQTAVARTALFIPASATPTPTPSATPSLTPTSAAPSLTFTPTPTPTVTVTGLQYCVIAGSVNVRKGPGVEFPVIDTLDFPACPYFDGRTDDGTWLRLSTGQAGYLSLGNGWINAGLLTRPDSQQPPVVPVPPTPSG